MHILVTNDDGIYAPGLTALIQAVADIAEISVIAPDRNWTACGHVKTLSRPIRIKPVRLLPGVACWSSDGSPADCVALAMLGFIQKPIDLVLSGINPNANVGSDITYSGTVTAAFEGALFDHKAVAVSFDAHKKYKDPANFKTPAAAAAAVVRCALQNDFPERTVLNMNVPDLPFNELAGISITRLGKRIYRDELVTREDPEGKPYYWIGGDSPTGVPEPGTDLGALAGGFVSICPLHLDMSAPQHHSFFEEWNLALHE